MTTPLFEDSPQSLPDEVDAFDEFWSAYPRKVGKRKARQALKSAFSRAGLGTILQGLARYIRNKPAYCDWMHPTTFLNGDHWEDEYDTALQRQPETPESLAIKAAHVLKPYYDGRYSRDVLEQCVREGLLTVEQMESKS